MIWFNRCMGAVARYVFRRHLFLLVGLLTFGFFLLVAALERAGKADTAAAFAIPMRVLIIPMYLGWLGATMATVAIAGNAPAAGVLRGILSVIGLAAGIAPYVLADYIRRRLRRTTRP